MPSRTQLFQMLPWDGGLNESLDPGMIQPNECTRCDNVIFDYSTSRKIRDGIDFNWDDRSNGSNSVIAIHDFWFGSPTKTQRKVAVLSNGKVYSYTSGGEATELTVTGRAWSGTLTSAQMITFNNKLFIAVSGSTNLMKCWDGSGNVEDVYGAYLYNPSVSRSSSGTTRTIVFTSAFYGTVGSDLIIRAAGSSSYNGTFTVASITTTSVTNDTITYTASGSLSESDTPDTGIVVGSPAPRASCMREHLGRIFCNDKTNPESIFYSAPGDHTVWNGWGDSGGMPVMFGDGDPVGISGILPPFKGSLIVGKATKLYRIDGYMPEDFFISKISDSIGIAGPNAMTAIDEVDILWVSQKGVHSLVATQSSGDLDKYYVSSNIQKTFNSFNKARLANVWVAYNTQANSVGFTFTTTAAGSNNALYLYHVTKQAWYTWSGISCQSLITANDADKYRFYIGSSTGRIAKTFNGTNYDVNSTGSQVPISYRVTTGQVFLDGNPFTMKALKRLVVYYRPTGSYNLTVNVTVDNHRLNVENSIAFSDIQTTDLLGSTFILGQSVLGYSTVLGPYIRTVDGIGRSIVLDMIQTQTGAQCDVQGFAIEWEPAGSNSEMFLT